MTGPLSLRTAEHFSFQMGPFIQLSCEARFTTEEQLPVCGRTSGRNGQPGFIRTELKLKINIFAYVIMGTYKPRVLGHF